MSPVTVIGDALLPERVTVMPPSGVTEVTVYDVIGLPPLERGAVKETVAFSIPEVAFTFVGALGAIPVLTALEASDAGPVPNALVAVTLKV